MKWIFAVLAIWGAIHPMVYFLQWFGENGFDLMAEVPFVEGIFHSHDG